MPRSERREEVHGMNGMDRKSWFQFGTHYCCFSIMLQESMTTVMLWGCWWEWWDWEMVSRCLAVDYAVFSAAFSLSRERWYCCMNICCSRHLHNINNAVLQPFFSLNSPSTNGKKKNSKALLCFFEWKNSLPPLGSQAITVRKKSLF